MWRHLSRSQLKPSSAIYMVRKAAEHCNNSASKSAGKISKQASSSPIMISLFHGFLCQAIADKKRSTSVSVRATTSAACKVLHHPCNSTKTAGLSQVSSNAKNLPGNAQLYKDNHMISEERTAKR